MTYRLARLHLAIIGLLAIHGQSSAQRVFVAPNFRDLTIKVRETRGLMRPAITQWFFKGARQRVDHMVERGSDQIDMLSSIYQCDTKTEILLRPFNRTYRLSSIPSDDSVRPRGLPHNTDRNAPEVLTTTVFIDTGERQQFAGYESRHIKSTITIEPGKGSTAKPGKVEVDTWYLDLVGAGCHDGTAHEVPPISPHFLPPIATHERWVFKQIGPIPRGFVVKQTAIQKEDGNSIVHKIELLEISDKPIADSLFEPPPDFTQRDPQQTMVPVPRRR
jgi:hypothetical protein